MTPNMSIRMNSVFFTCIRKALYGESAITIYEYRSDKMVTEVDRAEEDHETTH